MRALRPVVLDLDQTLIRAEVLDWALWLDAMAEAFGQPVPLDQDWGAYPVHTDHGLLESLSQQLRGRPFEDHERARFKADLFSRIDAALAADPGVFVPISGAGALLAALQGRSCLATGNLHPVTLRKLRSSGLDRWPLPCSCSGPGIDRAELVRRALLRVGWAPGAAATSFGDGVWDVRAARALGIGFVGVAQSDRHEARLRAAGAAHVIRDYDDLDAVLQLTQEAPLPGPESATAWKAPQAAE
jgi:phosphoglycolate phosphatase-like HAD superfamily hydrolase